MGRLALLQFFFVPMLFVSFLRFVAAFVNTRGMCYYVLVLTRGMCDYSSLSRTMGLLILLVARLILTTYKMHTSCRPGLLMYEMAIISANFPRYTHQTFQKLSQGSRRASHSNQGGPVQMCMLLSICTERDDHALQQKRRYLRLTHPRVA
jgi:hypothetical protein